MNNWQSFPERKPRKIRGQKFTPVIFCLHPLVGEKNRVCVGRYFHSMNNRKGLPWHSLQGQAYNSFQVIAWMPQPKPMQPDRSRRHKAVLERLKFEFFPELKGRGDH